MDDVEFWALVEAARDASHDNADERPGALEQLLMSRAPDEVQDFQDVYDEMLRRAHRWSLLGAATLMNGDCTDDGFLHFRDWLISEGRSVFEAALADPDTLADLPRLDGFELEDFGYVASDVYQQLTGNDLEPPLLDESREPEGEAWDEDDLEALFPRLAEKYGAAQYGG
jgi:hypothetical protein